MNPIQLFTWGRRRPTLISTWDTRNITGGSGTFPPTAANQIRLPFHNVGLGSPNCTIDWGDGILEHITDRTDTRLIHTYAIAGIYTIKITGFIHAWSFNASYDIKKILSITEWGPLPLISTSAFEGCSNLTLDTVKDIPRTMGPSFSSMFQGCTSITRINRLEEWNVSNINSFASTFSGCTNFNQTMNTWNTGSATTLSNMFFNCSNFNNGDAPGQSNIPLTFNTALVTVLSGIFRTCTVFNQPLPNWNTANNVTMASAFQSAIAFNQPLVRSGTTWSMTKVNSFITCFSGATNFNQDISSWDISTTALVQMNSMFSSASAFNQDLSAWNMSRVTTIAAMFSNCLNFNNGDVTNIASKPLNWDLSLCTAMGNTFSDCSKFNQACNFGNTTLNVTTMNNVFISCPLFNNGGSDSINNWNVSKVTTFASMFQSASAFNQPLNLWQLNTLANFSCATMFTSAVNFNRNLTSWNMSRCTTASSMFNGCSNFNNGEVGNTGANPLTWTMSVCTTINSMFADCIVFNQLLTLNTTNLLNSATNSFQNTFVFNNGKPLGVFGAPFILNTSGTTNMNQMFFNARTFNQDLNSLTMNTVVDVSSMFNGCDVFNNGELPDTIPGTIPLNWSFNACTTMASMFSSCPQFNQVCNFTNTGLVTTMANMFSGCNDFNNGLAPGAVGTMILDTSSVTIMGIMFSSANSFNQNISSWNVSKVISFSSMFNSADLFNNGVAGNGTGTMTWNINIISNVTMASMFSTATNFNQNIGSWNMSKVNVLTNFMFGKTSANYSAANLDAIYNGWIVNELITSLAAGFGSIKATSAGGEGRQLLGPNLTVLAILSITNVGGLFRIGTGANGRPVGTTIKVFIKGVTNYPTLNGLQRATVISGTVIEIIGVAFAGTGAADGTCRFGYGWTITDSAAIVSGAANNGGGLIRITTGAHGLVDGNTVYIYGVAGVTNANGTWTIDVPGASTTQFDLIGSTFAGTYTSGGVVVGSP